MQSTFADGHRTPIEADPRRFTRQVKNFIFIRADPRYPRLTSFLKTASAVILLAAFWLSASPAGAAAPDDDVPIPEAAEEVPQADQPPAEKSTDDELLKSLDDESKDFIEQALDHLQHAFDGMQTARRRIADEDTGAETQKTQERVVKDLEELLALVKKQQSHGQRPQQSQDKNKGQPQPERQQLPKEQSDPQNSGQKKSSENQKGSPDERRKEGNATDSQERTDAARAAAAEQARRRQAIKDVWGHLPPHVREAMLNSVSEKYLPKYEDLVKKYYEDLADKSRKRNGK